MGNSHPGRNFYSLGGRSAVRGFGEGLGFTSPSDFGSFISSTEFAKFEPLEHSFVATEFQPGGVFFFGFAEIRV
jgi:hypothetical protein